MSASWALSRATVVTPGGSYERATVVLRSGTATLRSNGSTVRTLDGAELEQLAARSWRLTGAGGESWDVTRKAGCGCGR